MSNEENWWWWGLAIVMAIALVALVVGLFDSLREGEAVEGIPQSRYSVIELEGMPCILIDSYHRLAVTCDWSKYD